MTNDELVRDHERRITAVETIIGGTVRDGKKVEGMYDTVTRHHVWLVGDKESGTTGLVQSVDKLITLVKYGTGALFAWHVFKEVYGFINR